MLPYGLPHRRTSEPGISPRGTAAPGACPDILTRCRWHPPQLSAEPCHPAL